jgi:hypothetical protein
MLHEPAVRDLMERAIERAKVPFDTHGTRRLIVKSISAKQRPRRPSDTKKK